MLVVTRLSDVVSRCDSNSNLEIIMKAALIGLAVFVLAMFALSSWSSNKTTEAQQTMQVVTLPNGVRIYEVSFNGTTYVVVEKHSGLGICKK